jgi:hypothetical protein
MKQITFILFMMFCFCGCNQTTNEIKDQEENNRKSNLTFNQDSGFITKKDGLIILFPDSLNINLNFYWNGKLESDTIGKYYRDGENGNYIISVVPIIDTSYSCNPCLLIEMKPNGTIVNKVEFEHSNTSCCVDNPYNEFGKIGDYFCLKTCSSGSGYCATYKYIFKNVIPQNMQNPIPESYYSIFSSTNSESKLSSVFEFHDKYIIVHYLFETGTIGDNSLLKINNTEKFDIKFNFQNNTWTTTDSIKLKSLDLT